MQRVNDETSPWSFRGRLQEGHKVFFEALARETGLNATVFAEISQAIVQRFLRTTIEQMLELTSLQMRQILSDKGGDVHWLTTIETMLGRSFGSSTAQAATTAVALAEEAKNAQNGVRITKFMSIEEDTLGLELHKKQLLAGLILPEHIFELVKTPSPKQR